MFKQPLRDISAHILRYNQYFNNGYPIAYMDQPTGYIYAPGLPGQDDIALFPEDRLGNYFYLRLPNDVKLISDNRYAVAEGLKGLGVAHNIILVACVVGADADALLGNLISTMQYFPKGNINFDKGIAITEQVIQQELSKMTPEAIKDAMANVGDMTCVSLQFTYTAPLLLKDPECLDNPCTTCNS